MTISELLQYCMAKPGAEQSVHSDWKATQIKVSDVLFAMVKEVEDQRPAVALKASPELAELLRQQHREHRLSGWLAAGFANLLPGRCVLSAGGENAAGAGPAAAYPLIISAWA